MKFSLALTTLVIASPFLASPLVETVSGVIVPFIVVADQNLNVAWQDQSLILKRKGGRGFAAPADSAKVIIRFYGCFI